MSKRIIEIEKSYFINNRERFFSEMKDNSIVVLFSGTPKRKTADQYYKFEGNNNFYYLTGIRQEGSVLIIKKLLGKIVKLLLCIRTFDAHEERWNGARINRDDASRISGIYDVSFSEGVDSILQKMLESWDGDVFVDKDASTGSDIWFSDYMEEKFPLIQLENIYPTFSKLRSIKSEYEVSLIIEALKVTCDGIIEMITSVKSGMKEYELAAIYAYVLAKAGLGDPSFESIVATGKNFNYLHYPQLDTQIQDGDMILIDVGASYGGLCSDISRAFPVDGKFSTKQLAIYNIVIECQDLAFRMIKPGTYIKDINKECMLHAGKRLIELGVIMDIEEAKEYYWHNVSHHLGLDVHDIYSRDMVLEEGMVITVEPGVYVPQWNVGLRIEDDVWVTSNGCNVLSDFIPRQAHEIESLFTK